MNDLLKRAVLDAIKKSNVVLTSYEDEGLDVYVLTNANGDILMEYTNCWKFGTCELDIHGAKYNSRFNENQHKGINKLQCDMSDILRGISERYAEQERARLAKKRLTQVEREQVNFLKTITTVKVN